MSHYKDLERKKRTDEAYKGRRRGLRRKLKLMVKYGITLEQWDAMLIAQCGRCAMCSDPMTDPCVDHDHKTGKVRGLVHGACNKALGHAGEDPERLRKMADYVELHKLG